MTETAERNAPEDSFRFWVSDYEAIIGLTLILVIIGSLNVFSSSFVVAESNYDDPYFFLRKQGMNVAVGFFFFVLGCGINYRYLMKGRKVAFYAVAALLLAVEFIGIEVNGAQRWLAIGSMQIAEEVFRAFRQGENSFFVDNFCRNRSFVAVFVAQEAQVAQILAYFFDVHCRWSVK